MKIKFDLTLERDRNRVYTLMKDQEEFEKFGEIASVPIRKIFFDTRISNALHSVDITTLGELCVVPDWHLKRIPNLGDKSITEIKEGLEKIGLELPTARSDCPRCSS